MGHMLEAVVRPEHDTGQRSDEDRMRYRIPVT